MSSKKPHTPGPWKVFGPVQTGFSSHFFNVQSDKETICQTSGDMSFKIPDNLDEQRANAQLISAAPDLLAALERSLDFLDLREDTPAYQKIKNAIKKAKGEL